MKSKRRLQTKSAGQSSAMSPGHISIINQSKNSKLSSTTTMSFHDLQSSHIIIDENENMDIDGALDNSLLSEPPGSDFR